MITQSAFPVEPWCLRETELDLDLLPHAESLFALSNGHIGWRANLDEGEPFGLPGSYVNGLHELRPLPYAEAGYGYPESGQTVINVTNGKLIRLLVDDEPFDLRYGTVRHHERMLDFRAGVLERAAEWQSPTGRTVKVRSTRLVSLTQRAIAAICYEVEPVDGPVRVVVQSELVANEELPGMGGDPRMAAVLSSPLASEWFGSTGVHVGMIHSTKRSGLRLAAAMDHVIESIGAEGGPQADLMVDSECFADVGRVTVAALLHPGQKLRLVKFVAYGWSATRTLPAMRDQVEAALVAARQTGWAGLLEEQRASLDEFWQNADVEVDGDPEIQQAVRFALFHIHQAGARAEVRAIPAKGLTGTGYDGHAFWDTESFVLPVLTYTAPQSAAHALRWRHTTLPDARERAKQLGLSGAAFPWRTIAGQECSSYWPAGTAAFHINADIADAVIRYLAATGDHGFEAEVGLELLVETARLWNSLGHYDGERRFRISGVTGPDEYSAVADNNVYTNLMAQQNLRAAAESARRHPDLAKDLHVSPGEIRDWLRAAEAMFVPYDERLRVHPQAEGFTEHEVWDFDATDPEHYPLLLHYPYFDLYRKQVVKQADLVLAMFSRGDAFTSEQKARNFEYYERLTVRDSSLSACCQAVIAAEVGHLGLAYDYLGEAALMDLDNLEHNTADGLHLASLAGSWLALVAGFGGLRDQDGRLAFSPRLPRGWRRLAFRMLVRGSLLRVEIRPGQAEYSLVSGPALEVSHYGQIHRVAEKEPVVLGLPSLPELTAPLQPPGRAPQPRTATHE
ncbi:MAG TPA: glycoside hydrolase family 65 protein [Actinocrinis sp.]|nr:glycoside hydrolase family 65 protein [Actinocrinis sp.]